jgi:hypothetical protein
MAQSQGQHTLWGNKEKQFNWMSRGCFTVRLGLQKADVSAIPNYPLRLFDEAPDFAEDQGVTHWVCKAAALHKQVYFL